MKLEFTHSFNAPRDRVWEAMLDPGVLSRIIPGVERFEAVGEDEYDATLKLGIPAVKGEYKGSVKITDKKPMSSYILEGGGKGVQGWAKGKALVEFVESGDQTTMNVSADAQLGGRMAGVGQRMIEGVAKMMAEEFFSAFARELQGETTDQTSPVAFFFRALWRSIRGLFGRNEAKA